MTLPASPLLALHQRVDAELQAYDAIDIVSTFGEPQAEYAAIRKACGVFDLPQRGFIELTGKDRHAFLNNLLTNELVDKGTKTPLVAGRWLYAFLLNLKGRIVCDLNVIETDTGSTVLEVDVRLAPMLVGLFDRYLFAEQVKVADRSADWYEVALHGPLAFEVLTKELGGAFTLPPNGTTTTAIAGVSIQAWRDDACGVPGVNLVVKRAQAVDLWQHLLARYGGEISLGKRTLRPVGWAAFNATRIEAGRPLFGVDFELAPPSLPGKKAEAEPADGAARPVGVLPAETGQVARAVSFVKGCYLGQEVVARMHARSQVARQWVGLRVDDDALPVAGAQIFDDDGAVVGMVTSSTMSPMLSDTAVAIGVLRKPFFEVGRRVKVAAEGAVRGATVVAMPFIQPEQA